MCVCVYILYIFLERDVIIIISCSIERTSHQDSAFYDRLLNTVFIVFRLTLS